MVEDEEEEDEKLPGQEESQMMRFIQCYNIHLYYTIFYILCALSLWLLLLLVVRGKVTVSLAVQAIEYYC